MLISYRKAAAAQPSYALYTADRPASWDVLVDGVVRGSIVGRVTQYSAQRLFYAVVDGERLSRTGYGRLKDAKHAVARALGWAHDRSSAGAK